MNIDTAVRWILRHRRLVVLATLIATLVAPVSLLRLTVDTDPEGMLAADDPVRVRNAEVDETFGGGDQIAAAVTFPDPVSAEGLAALRHLEQEVTALPGVAARGVVGPSIATPPGGPPSADDVALARSLIDGHAVLGGQVFSPDGKTATLLIGLDEASAAPEIAEAITELTARDTRLGDADVAIAGAPLAREVFGQQMFLQMAIFAPLAALAVVALVYWFFRRLSAVAATMTLALVTVIWTMSLLIAAGHTLHIMSSMIPIFLLPIAILDAVHVLSEYGERADGSRDPESTIRAIYRELARPLTFTTLTTAVGFASLALTPIPPVQTFGVFVAVGVAIAWLLTMVLLPILLLRIEPTRVTRRRTQHRPLIAKIVGHVGAVAVRRRRTVVVVAGVTALAATAGLTQIQVNDHPVEWFRSNHPVRQAAESLDERLAGTHNLNLVVTDDRPGALLEPSTAVRLDALATDLEDLDAVGSVASYTELAAGDPFTAALITRDASAANLSLRLHGGDNRTVQRVVAQAEALLAERPLPPSVSTAWAGQSFLNLTWQQQMVSGMTRSFVVALALLAVFLVLLFRSLRWGLVAMLPVAWTVLVVYGAIGWLGIDFDMPIAVLSTLALGIGVDFAIHFVSRFRALDAGLADRRLAVRQFMEEPGRAVTRNALIVAVGFLPLLAAPLVPYVVVGVLLGTIMILSWLATMLLLPAVVVGPRRTVGVPAVVTPSPQRVMTPARD